MEKLRELQFEDKVFRIGGLASYGRGWGHNSRKYVGVVGTITEIRHGAITIEMPDGSSLGPTPKNAYPISYRANKDAKILLEKEW